MGLRNSNARNSQRVSKGGELNMKYSLIITILLVVVVGGGAFFAGMKYQESKRNFAGGQFGSFQGQRNDGGNRNRMGTGFRPVNGDIISSDDKSITVKSSDGSSRIVLYSQSTSITKAAQGAVSDLKTGEKVAVFGTQNADGSITAQNIQLNPNLRGGDRQPNPSPTP